MAGNKNKRIRVVSYDVLKQTLVQVTQEEYRSLGKFIPADVAVDWRIGQVLVWYTEDLLENLALDLRRECGKPWQILDLTQMIQLYLRHPTLEMLAGKCAGRNKNLGRPLKRMEKNAVSQ